MKSINARMFLVAAATVFALAGCGTNVMTLPVAPVTGNTGDTAAQDVALYFGDQPHPVVQREIDSVRTDVHIARQLDHSSNEASCNQALGQALDRLRSGARKRGANAVIGISTRFHNQTNTSPDTYTCGISPGAVALYVYGHAVVLKGE